jgi:hypothetical protein
MCGERQLWSFVPECKKETAAKFEYLTAEIVGETPVANIYRAAAAPVTCKIICVPASNFTFRLAELTTEP